MVLRRGAYVVPIAGGLHVQGQHRALRGAAQQRACNRGRFGPKRGFLSPQTALEGENFEMSSGRAAKPKWVSRGLLPWLF